MHSGAEASALALQADALLQAAALPPAALVPSPWPRLLTLAGAAQYYSLSEDVIAELIAAGTLRRVTVPAPVTAKRRGGAIRRVLIDRADLDALVQVWKGHA